MKSKERYQTRHGHSHCRTHNCWHKSICCLRIFSHMKFLISKDSTCQIQKSIFFKEQNPTSSYLMLNLIASFGFSIPKLIKIKVLFPPHLFIQLYFEWRMLFIECVPKYQLGQELVL